MHFLVKVFKKCFDKTKLNMPQQNMYTKTIPLPKVYLP